MPSIRVLSILTAIALVALSTVSAAAVRKGQLPAPLPELRDLTNAPSSLEGTIDAVAGSASISSSDISLQKRQLPVGDVGEITAPSAGFVDPVEIIADGVGCSVGFILVGGRCEARPRFRRAFGTDILHRPWYVLPDGTALADKSSSKAPPASRDVALPSPSTDEQNSSLAPRSEPTTPLDVSSPSTDAQTPALADTVLGSGSIPPIDFNSAPGDGQNTPTDSSPLPSSAPIFTSDSSLIMDGQSPDRCLDLHPAPLSKGGMKGGPTWWHTSPNPTHGPHGPTGAPSTSIYTPLTSTESSSDVVNFPQCGGVKPVPTSISGPASSYGLLPSTLIGGQPYPTVTYTPLWTDGQSPGPRDTITDGQPLPTPVA